jgi:hypothetical protein
VVHGVNGNAPGAIRAVIGTAGFAVAGFAAGVEIGEGLEDDDCREEDCWDGPIWGSVIGTTTGLVLWGTIDSLLFAQVEEQEPQVFNRRPRRHGKPITWQPSIKPVMTSATSNRRAGIGGLTVGIQGQF